MSEFGSRFAQEAASGKIKKDSGSREVRAETQLYRAQTDRLKVQETSEQAQANALAAEQQRIKREKAIVDARFAAERLASGNPNERFARSFDIRGTALDKSGEKDIMARQAESGIVKHEVPTYQQTEKPDLDPKYFAGKRDALTSAQIREAQESGMKPVGDQDWDKRLREEGRTISETPIVRPAKKQDRSWRNGFGLFP